MCLKKNMNCAQSLQSNTYDMKHKKDYEQTEHVQIIRIYKGWNWHPQLVVA